MSKDTFLTTAYKGSHIHSHYDRTERREIIRIQFSDNSVRHNIRTQIGAKRIITRHKQTA